MKKSDGPSKGHLRAIYGPKEKEGDKEKEKEYSFLEKKRSKKNLSSEKFSYNFAKLFNKKQTQQFFNLWLTKKRKLSKQNVTLSKFVGASNE